VSCRSAKRLPASLAGVPDGTSGRLAIKEIAQFRKAVPFVVHRITFAVR